MKRMTRVALITSGGDCQGLNAAIRGVAKALFEKLDNVEIYGMYDGYRGLIECDYKFMEPGDFSHSSQRRSHAEALPPSYKKQ